MKSLQDRCLDGTSEGVLREQRRQIAVEAAQLRQATSDYDCIRIEDVHHTAETACSAVFQAVKSGVRIRISLLAGGNNLGTGELLPGHLMKIALQTSTGDPQLDAPQPPTVAER